MYPHEVIWRKKQPTQHLCLSAVASLAKSRERRAEDANDNDVDDDDDDADDIDEDGAAAAAAAAATGKEKRATLIGGNPNCFAGTSISAVSTD